MTSLLKFSALILGVFIFSDVMPQWWGNRSIKGSGNVVTKTITTDDYDVIKGVGFMDIHLEYGTEGAITVTTDDNLHEYIDIEVEGNKLILKTRKGYSISTNKGIHVTVPFKKITKVVLAGSGDIDSKNTIKTSDFKTTLAGSGDINLTVEATYIEVEIAGSGDITLNGSTEKLEVELFGSGDFRGFGLDSKNTSASVSGSGDIRIVANNHLTARVTGSGDIVYKGNPSDRDTNTVGSGEISSY